MGAVPYLALISALAALGLAVFFYTDVRRAPAGNDRMVHLMTEIQTGARAFLRQEYTWVAVFVVVLAVLIAALIQIEAAVRQLASTHPYDEHAHEDSVSLRGDSAQVAEELQVMLGERLHRAGIEVLEARLSHLAYAPEIASAMLQRQQAQAIIAARTQIVDGAVGMVEQALNHLGERGVVELDDERRATLVGNLLVVLCGQANPTPVMNTGSLYT